MQAVSGAGYPGVPSLDILGNVIPFIGDEEPKIEAEVRKFLGSREARRSRARRSRERAREPRRRWSTATPFASRSALERSAGADEASSSDR